MSETYTVFVEEDGGVLAVDIPAESAAVLVMTSPDIHLISHSEQGPAGPAVEETGVAAGEYLKVTVDVYGRVVSGSDPNSLTLSDFLNVQGDVTLGDASGDTLRINAGTWTYGANWTATRAAGALPSGTTDILTSTVTFTGDSGGTTTGRSHRGATTISGSNALSGFIHRIDTVTFQPSATSTSGIANYTNINLASSGSITNGSIFAGQFTGSNTGGLTTATIFEARGYSSTGSGPIGTFYGFRVLASATSLITTHVAFKVDNTSSAANVRGLQSSLSSGANKYNLYIDGTAGNYFAGHVSIGTTAAAYPMQIAAASATTDRAISATMAATGTVAEYGTLSVVTANNTSGGGNKFALYGSTTIGSSFAGSGNLWGAYTVATMGQAVTVAGGICGYGALCQVTAATTLSAGYTAFHAETLTNSGGGTVASFTGVNILAQTVGTNIYGIRSQIASGTNRWNLYIDGNAANYIAGILQLGVNTFDSSNHLYVAGSAASNGVSGVTQRGILVGIRGGTDATTALNAVTVSTLGGNAGSPYTTSAVRAFAVNNHTLGTNQTVTTQVGLEINDLTSGTNNYGIRSSITSGANKFNLYLSGTADNYIVGNTGFAALPQTNTSLYAFRLAAETAAGERAIWAAVTANNASGSNTKAAFYATTNFGSSSAGTSYVPGLWVQNSFQNAGTFASVAVGMMYDLSITAAANVTTVSALQINSPTNTGGGTLTNFYGINISAQTVGTNIYGVRSAIAAAANRWNFYIDGTANNAFAGNVRIGSTTAPTVALDVTGSAIISSTLTVSGLTSGRLPLVSTAGLLTDSATFTYVDTSAIRAIAVSASASSVATISATNTHASGNASIGVSTAGSGTASAGLISSTGDAYVSLSTNGAGWNFGQDASVSNRFVVGTAALGSADKFAITTSGSVILNASGSALSTSATDGFTYVPSCAGTPTGVPTAVTGAVPIVVDSTNNKLYFYSGGAWRDAGP